MSVNILLAESDMFFLNLIKDVLENEGYNIYDAKDGVTALDIFMNNQDISLVLLDFKLQKIDGIKVLNKIREKTTKSYIPVIMIIDNGDYADELSAFRNGANDCISKPVNCDILVERIKSMIRLANPDRLNTTEYGILAVNYLTNNVYVNGEKTALSKKEYKMLLLFIDNENNVLSREKILNEIWKKDYDGDVRAVDTYVKLLRIKLGDAGKYIRTVRGKGYGFFVL